MARRIHVESRAIEAPTTPPASPQDIANAFVRSFGWQPPHTWTTIDREGAIEVLSSALQNDLVDDAPKMPFREAEEHARQFVDGCGDEGRGVVLLTNGTIEETRKGFGRHSITAAKADAGVIAVSSTRVTMTWIEDGGTIGEARRR